MKPALWRRIPGKWTYMLRIFARRPEDDVEAELHFHFDERAAELIGQGVSPDAARAQTHEEFGDVKAVRTSLHDIGHRIAEKRRRAEWWEGAAQTFRYAVRGLRRSPGFLVVSTISLGLGIGLSTATFAYVQATARPKLPYADVDQLRFVRLGQIGQVHAPPLREVVATVRELPSVDAIAVMFFERRKSLTVNGVPDGNRGVSRFSANAFDVLGLKPKLGRWPSVEEIRAGSAAVVMDYLWQRAYGDRKEIGDAHVVVDGVSVPIVGVLPRDVYVGSEVWIPLAPSANFGPDDACGCMVRLKRGVSRATIDAQLAGAAAQLTAKYVTSPGDRHYILSFPDYGLAGRWLSDQEITLLGIAIGILMIAATNVAALSLARAHSRRRDAAVRIALGASRGAIARALLAEVGLMSVLGAVAGAAFSVALIGLITYMTPEQLVGTASGVRLPVVSPSLFAYVLFGLVVSILIAGGIPAFRTSRIDPADPLKDNAGTTTGRARSEFRVMLIGELAIAMVLTTLTALLLISTKNLAEFDFGFDFRTLVEAVVWFGPGDPKAPPLDPLVVYTSVLARARATPGAGMVTTFTQSELSGADVFSRPTYGAEHTLTPDGMVYDAGPDAFRTLGITVLDGRDFTDGDRAIGDKAILTERAARALFPRKNAVGSTIKIGRASTHPWLRVIGVVRDIRFNTTGRGDPEIFVSSKDVTTFGSLRVISRPAGKDPQFMTVFERSVAAALPPFATVHANRMAGNYEQQVDRTRFFTRSLTFIGVCALLLAATGLFSVLSFTVGRRMREFAVRVALGAAPQQVLMVVMKDGFEVALAGAAIGALLSFWASAGISGALFGIRLTDPIGIVIAEVALLGVTSCASIVPALRAAKADPMDVLRAI